MRFARNFMMGQQIAQNALDTYEMARRKASLAEVMGSTPEQRQGFTEEQAGDLHAAAASGQYDIGIKTNADGTFASYTVTPKADPTQTGTVAMQGVTDFLGKRYAGTLDEGQIMGARQRALAGVLMKNDPIQGMRMLRDLKTDERDDARWDRQTKTWEREDREQAKRDEYETGRQQLFGQTRFAQTQAQYQQQMAEYQQQLEAWKQNPTGLQPVAPTRPEYSIGDSLADRAMLIDHDAKYGRLDARTFGEFTDLMQRVQSEGYERTLRLAQSGAPVQEVIKAFNGTGKVQADPANIVSDKMVKRPDGVTTRAIQYRDANGQVRTIDTVAELDALGKAGDVFTRYFQVNQDRRADTQLQLNVNADRRAAGNAQREREEARARADAAVAIYKERNPNATPAELEAVRRGVIEALPKVDDKAPAEVKLARAALEAGVAGVTDMASALQWARGRSEDTPRSTYLSMMKPQNGISPREEDVAKIMEEVYGPQWRDKIRTQGGGSRAASAPAPAQNPKPLQNVTDADIKATAQKYGITEEEVRRRLNLK